MDRTVARDSSLCILAREGNTEFATSQAEGFSEELESATNRTRCDDLSLLDREFGHSAPFFMVGWVGSVVDDR